MLTRSLPDWNKGKTFAEFGTAPGYLLVADDAVGGFFALNGGALGDNAGKIFYLAPDNLQWECLEMGYSDFLNFCFNGDLDKFYKDFRWKGWKADLAKLGGDQAFSFFPYPWTKEGKAINKTSKKAVPVAELYLLEMQFRRELGLENSH